MDNNTKSCCCGCNISAEDKKKNEKEVKKTSQAK